MIAVDIFTNSITSADMTEEQRVSLIRKFFVLFLVIAIGAGTWFYHHSKKDGFASLLLRLKLDLPDEKPPAELSPKREDCLTIIHFHLPGNPASDQLANVLTKVGNKYGEYVDVTQAGFQAQPKDWLANAGIKLPYVLMITGSKIVFQFQGAWSQPMMEKKVDEILFSIKSMDKNWRPDVPGMIRKGG